MIKYSKDGLVAFDEGPHTYHKGDTPFVQGTKQLVSVTTYLEQFKHPFDTEAVAEEYALKNNMETQEVIDMWTLKGLTSSTMGTAIHLIFEKYILGLGIVKPNIYIKEAVVELFIQEIFETGKLKPIETELIVYDDENAGQIDNIVKNAAGDYFILDWKSNEKIDRTSFNYRMMKGPYSKYMDCKLYWYKAQLNKYKDMFNNADHGYKIKGCYIVHIDIDSYEFIKV